MGHELTLRELRRFILYKQGVLGDYRFAGKDGVLTYIRQAGCIQFDPIDMCGRNAELTLQIDHRMGACGTKKICLCSGERIVGRFEQNR